jgi:hypothetical protein
MALVRSAAGGATVAAPGSTSIDQQYAGCSSVAMMNVAPPASSSSLDIGSLFRLLNHDDALHIRRGRQARLIALWPRHIIGDGNSYKASAAALSAPGCRGF